MPKLCQTYVPQVGPPGQNTFKTLEETTPHGKGAQSTKPKNNVMQQYEFPKQYGPERVYDKNAST